MIQIKQCGSCDGVFIDLTVDKTCPYCGSGNWVNGFIDEPQTLTDAQIEKLDENDSLIVNLIENFLGVECNYEDDDMCDIVHTIGDMISEWGEKQKGVPEIESYPYVLCDEEENDRG